MPDRTATNLGGDSRDEMTAAARLRCVFCARIEADQFERSWSALDVVAFSPRNPVTPGHLLVVPGRHVPDATYSHWITANTMQVAAIVAGEVGDCNIITSCGAAATQTVMHLHVHVVPRRVGDGLALPWTGQRLST